MSLILAYDDIKPEQVKRGGGGSTSRTSTSFIRATPENPIGPTAFMVRYDPGHVSSTHFHEVDQFQVLVDGKGRFGRHDVTPYSVHFSRAYTAYGPLQSDPEKGWAFMTLRTRFDPGAQRFPAAQEKLKQVVNRQPRQVTEKVSFPVEGSGARFENIPNMEDDNDHGLFARSISMAPHTRTTTPDPAGGDGQYVLLVKGSLIHEDKEHKALAVVFIKPDEGAFHLCAGAQGLRGLVLNFPQVAERPANARDRSPANGFRKWQCALCAFSYDEAVGMPGDGIAAGTRWADVPDSWSCPDCSASKGDFQMVEV